MKFKTSHCHIINKKIYRQIQGVPQNDACPGAFLSLSRALVAGSVLVLILIRPSRNDNFFVKSLMILYVCLTKSFNIQFGLINYREIFKRMFANLLNYLFPPILNYKNYSLFLCIILCIKCLFIPYLTIVKIKVQHFNKKKRFEKVS